MTRYLINFFKLELNKDLEVFLASMASSVALFLADPKDMNLLKLLILPRALESIYCLLEEKGLVKPLPHGQTLLHISGIVVTVYFFIHEPFNLEPSMRRSVTSYMNLIKTEKDLKDSFTNIMLNNIKAEFPRYRLN